MEFLAESIGLLDLDPSSRAYVASPPDQNEGKPTNSNGGSTNSRSLFGRFDDDMLKQSDETPSSQRQYEPSAATITANPSSSYDDDELEQYLFHESSQSLLSTLSPDTPLTLSASSLNFRSHHDIATNDQCDDATDTTTSRPQRTTTADSVITKTITHRLTSQGCFSGNIDAITGRPIHGTLIYKNGCVYEGSFGAVGELVRHGNGECVYPHDCCNSEDGGTVKFVGRYEHDVPRHGIWFGNGWVYEGDLSIVSEIEIQQKRNGSNTATTSIGSSNLRIGITNPLPDNVLFHGTGRFMKKNGYSFQGEFVAGLACGVGKEILPEKKQVYYGEFWEGLRHGVGTLLEYYSCEVHCDDDDESTCEAQDHDASLHSLDLENASSDADNTRSSNNNGPDFAAGGSNSLSTERNNHNVPLHHQEMNESQTASPATNNRPALKANSNNVQQHTPSDNRTTNRSSNDNASSHKIQYKKAVRQRFSTGVWIAGQYEIEDSRGILNHNSIANNNTKTTECDTAKGEGRVEEEMKEKEATSPSLNRTTWDLLDEKWLGLG